MTTSSPNPLLVAAREAAWNGDHVQAIALCTETLGEDQLDLAARLDLYDTRAESYVAQGQLDLAEQDALAMVEIAGEEKRPEFEAQALNRQALVQMRQGHLETAAIIATRALEAAQAGEKVELEAQSLFRLAEVQSRVGQSEQSIETATKAAALYKTLGDLAGEGRALWAAALGYFKLSQNDEVFRVIQTALALCQQAGDLYGVGNALNVLTFVDPDIAKNMKRLEQGRHAFESAGYLERQAICTGNLATNYSALGLHRRARRLLLEAIEISRRMGARLLLAYNLSGLIETEIDLEHSQAGYRYLIEVAEMVPTLGDPLVSIQIPLSEGRIALLENDPPAAITHFKNAVHLAREAGDLTTEIWSLICLGQAYLLNGDPSEALTATTRAAELHRAHALRVLDGFPSQELWWRHSQVLSTNQQSEAAQEALNMAYHFLLDGIASMSDEGLRRNYLNKDKG